MSDHLCCDGNYLECIGGDGLVLSSASNVRVSKNICYFASYLGRKGYWNAGIWVYNVKGCRFENNECGYTYRLNGAEDGQGFDLDNCCEDVYFVNNLAHHNQGGGLLCCNLATSVPNEKEKQQGRWGNNWVYRNLFYHNGDKKEPTRSAMLTIARQTNCAIYRNNLVLLSPEIVNQSIVHTEDESTFCYFNRFERNLFLSEGDNGARFSMKMMKDSSFRNNAFFHVKKKGSKPIELEKMPPVMSFDEDIFAIPSLSKRIQFAFARAKRAFSFMKGGFKS